MSEKQLYYSHTEQGSFCVLICGAMGLLSDDDVAISWWEEYKAGYHPGGPVNNKRADVTAAIKRAFLSK
jgi:hypothetical protein